MITVLLTRAQVAALYPAISLHFDRRVTRWTQRKLLLGEVVLALAAIPESESYAPEAVMGLCAVFLDEEGIERGVTVVHRDHRSRGIGSALLALRTEIYPGVVSRVWEGNTASLRMCARAGHTVQGEAEANGKRILLVGDTVPRGT